MLNETQRAVGIASVATAALQLALVQQNQFEEVLQDTVDRQREQTEKVKKAAENTRGEAVVGALVEKAPQAKDVPSDPAVAPAPAPAPDQSLGKAVNIEV